MYPCIVSITVRQPNLGGAWLPRGLLSRLSGVSPMLVERMPPEAGWLALHSHTTAKAAGPLARQTIPSTLNRIQDSWTFVSLNARLESNREKEEEDSKEEEAEPRVYC